MHHRQVSSGEIDILAQAIQIAVNQINVAWDPNTGECILFQRIYPGLIS